MSATARVNDALRRRLRALQRRARTIPDPSMKRRLKRLARVLGASIEEAEESGGLDVERVGL